VARALFKAPKFIIADEPTADLDTDSALLIMQALRKRTDNGAIVLFITHDSSLINDDDLVQQMRRID
jgi:putative ABC transport system ATP-binding protein